MSADRVSVPPGPWKITCHGGYSESYPHGLSIVGIVSNVPKEYAAETLRSLLPEPDHRWIDHAIDHAITYGRAVIG